MVQLIKKKIESKKPLSLKDFHEKRNKILIWHDKGGLGDVLMQRMFFKNFKELCPSASFTFACLPEYMDAVKDHPYINEVIDSRTVNVDEYCIHYNTCVTIADRYENTHAPFCLEHRSDIWAKYCGVTLTDYDMQFRIDENLFNNCKLKIKDLVKNDKPNILFSPVSKMPVKTLLPWQMEVVKNYTKENFNLILIHNRETPELKDLGIPGIYNASIKEWMAYISCADYVVSVDTATFHMAGGLKKPLVGIFTFADGKAYGKHFDFVLVQKHRDNGNWDCGPCFKFGDCPKCDKSKKPCLTELTKEEIETGIKLMFDKWVKI